VLLANKYSVITGCNRGIGKAILATFAENGSNVWSCVRKPSDEFEQYAKDLSIRCDVEIIPVYFDLLDYGQIKLAIKDIMSRKKPVDILVNNAGITFNSLFQMSTVEKMKEVFDINFFSQMYLSQMIIKLMLRNKSGGSIINISSTAGLDGNAGRSIYGASKAAIICATKAIAAEHGDSGIRANTIAPGLTQTEMLSSMTDEIIKDTANQSHLKRVGDPDEIAAAALFLASDLSSYVTGQVLRVDGGLG
jgi:3-oxoacyl-[acyl-carrier protein] reductase